MIDTLKLSKGLQKAGMTEAQADGITEALNQAQADTVTKNDLDSTKTELQRDLDLAKRDLKNDLDSTKTELQRDLDLAKRDLKNDLDSTKTELQRDLDLAKRDFKNDLELAKKVLELAIERLRGELQRFILVSVVLVAIAQILVIKIWR